MRVAVTPKVSVEVRGDLWRSAFDSGAVFDDHGLAAELNRESQTFDGGINYRLTPLTTITVSSNVSTIRFTEASFRDTDSNQTLVGVELNPRALISGSRARGVSTVFDRAVPRSRSSMASSALHPCRIVWRPTTSIGFTFNRPPTSHTSFSNRTTCARATGYRSAASSRRSGMWKWAWSERRIDISKCWLRKKDTERRCLVGL